MLQDDYILRQIREMVRAVMKMLFQVSAVELTPDVIEDTDARQILTNLTDLADNGKIDEAENQLYEMTCDGDRQNLEIGLLFYYHLNGKDDEFLEASNFSREEIMMGIQDLAEHSVQKFCKQEHYIMNKKEISEIKKQFSPNNCAITRICGCYVDGEKNKKTELKEAFLSLSEEEMFKYFEIFKKTLSGTIGKNLINMDFPLEQEKEGGTQEFLMKLRGSKLQDNAILEEFYDKIIENYDYGENYYIILIHAVYDIPGKSSDGQEMFDASDEIYDHILCSICPVNLSKAGLCYNAETNNIEDRIRDWIVEMPDLGFLFPVFNDRSTDIHSLLYYTKNAEQLRSAFVDEMFGCTTPLSAGGQRDSFNALVEETLGEDCAYDTVMNIHEKLNEWVDSQKDSPDPAVLTKPEVKRLFEECGVENEKLETFDQTYEAIAGENASLMASNITNTRRTEIKTPDVVIHIDPDRAALIETQVIDGRKCIVIPMEGDVEINGIHVSSGNSESTES